MNSTNDESCAWVKDLQIFRETIHYGSDRSHIEESVDRSVHHFGDHLFMEKSWSFDTHKEDNRGSGSDEQTCSSSKWDSVGKVHFKVILLILLSGFISPQSDIVIGKNLAASEANHDYL